ncbi:MAG: bifunctional [glutamate--ammonia ligase]-adenylyl-L-tyrosine phosphorylase/[glutamate--ammonia-ligase] adenylyltransferase [Nitrospirae bacterium]|nr:bifunctional [glutamate--ammonia ligase]-adenylyl-L-tyrosine phosphorylase/[glutamate--ammonia-ligase] adenylyltransferase [Nitrospirota bacterium]
MPGPDVSGLKSLTGKCPDPERAYKNIEAFLSGNPDYAERLISSSPQIATLFSYSQFLANYCIRKPDTLFDALGGLDSAFETGQLRGELKEALSFCGSINDGLRAVRIFKKDKLLVVTLKDILKHAGLQEVMPDLSTLADAILSESLHFVESFLIQRYGAPGDNPLVVIGLGKLGAQELNYSSDVDIIFAYRDEGETSGISTIQGVTRNKVTAFEYYTKFVEEYNRFLSANTEDGFVYRVDLRLRPQGQRGGLALSLRGYEEYYESWGQLWERAALLRTRPVAGDTDLGNEFLEVIKPFVYRKYLDFQAIDEIRRMKSQVEQIKSGTLSKDIKRGYGGIREIEFFIQIFQLIYGGKEPLLRERSTLKALHRLLQKGLIGHDDFLHLSDNYVFLRTLEHRLQQVNDIQTHTLPSGDRELDILGRKMEFTDRTDFLPELDRRRHRVRAVYDSLLEVRGRKPEDTAGAPDGLLNNIFWEMETPVEHLLAEELSKTHIRDVDRAIRHLVKIRNTIYSFQTIRGRRLLEQILPRFIDEALKGSGPDLALLHLVDFSALMAAKESYLEIISHRHEIIATLNFILSNSEYLSRILMSNPEYMESLVEGETRKKPLKKLNGELKVLIDMHGESTAVRLFRRFEEIRLGILFLNRTIGVVELTNALSKVAEAVLLSLMRGQEAGSKGHDNPPSHPLRKGGNRGDLSPNLAAVGFGKLGGREITFNSDLDLVFMTSGEPTAEDVKAAERLLKASMSYTKDGIAYKMDTRLRPEGSKGPLVSSIKGIDEYYTKYAQAWELQALLKARPVSDDKVICKCFMKIRERVLTGRGKELSATDIKRMRERIHKELSKDSKELSSSGNKLKNRDSFQSARSTVLPFDIKLGSGGLEELEFLVQYLQIKNCHNNPQLLVQGTLTAINRLSKTGILKDGDAHALKDTYIFYRNIETILRLRNEPLLKEAGDSLQSMTDIMDVDREKILNVLSGTRREIRDFWERLIS